MLFLEMVLTWNCWIADLIRGQLSTSLELFCGGGSLLVLFEIKSSYLSPYPSPDVLLDLDDPKSCRMLL